MTQTSASDITTLPPPDMPFDIRTMTDKEAHVFALGVANMATDLQALRSRHAEALAENGRLLQRVALQKQTITQLRRTDDAPRRARRVVEAIDAAVGDRPCACLAPKAPPEAAATAPDAEPESAPGPRRGGLWRDRFIPRPPR